MKKLIYYVECLSHVYNEEKEELEKIPSLSMVTVENPTSENIAEAAKVAYNGEYTIEDDGEPASLTVWDELDGAYQAGYQVGYTEGVNEAYDQ